MMPFMVHRLGSTVYGFWILLLSLTGYMGIFDQGMRGSAVKYVAEFMAKKSYEDLNRVVNTIGIIQGSIGLSVLILSILLSIYVERFIHISSPYIFDVKVTIILLGINIACSFFGGAFGSILEACKRTDIISMMETSSLILQTVLTIICVVFKWGIIALGIVLLFVNALRQITRVWFASKMIPQLKISHGYFNRTTLKKVFEYSTYIFILSLASRLIFRTDNIVIGAILGASSITSYNIALSLVGYYMTIHTFSAGVLVPFASEYEANVDKEKLSRLFIKATKYMYMLTGLIIPILIFGGKRLIGLWMGHEFVSNHIILVILLAPYFLSPSYFVTISILKGMGRLRVYTSLVIIEGVSNLVLSIVLARKIGLIGVAIGTAIPFIIMSGFIVTTYMLRILNVDVKRYFKLSISPALIPAAILSCAVILLNRNTQVTSLIWYFLELGVCAAIYIISCFYLSLDKEEKSFYLGRVLHIIKPVVDLWKTKLKRIADILARGTI